MPAAGKIMKWWSKVSTQCPPYATVLWFFLCISGFSRINENLYMNIDNIVMVFWFVNGLYILRTRVILNYGCLRDVTMRTTRRRYLESLSTLPRCGGRGNNIPSVSTTKFRQTPEKGYLSVMTKLGHIIWNRMNTFCKMLLSYFFPSF